MNKISIALCTFNGAKFLPPQLESFLTQTRPPDELTVSDDCSTDETAKIIKDFAKVAPFPVHLQINQKNVGSTKNFEQTIARCTGNLIFLSDQDDVWMPQKISRMENEFTEDADLALVFSDAELVDENLRPLGKKLWDFTFPVKKREASLGGKMFEVLLDQNVATGATMAFRREAREACVPVPDNIPNLIHDAWIALVIAADRKIKFIEEPLVKYRQHSNQQLGINFHTRQKKNYEERKKMFTDSIRFFQNEEKRLKLLKEILKDSRIFEKKRENVSIDELIAEKQAMIEHYKARQALPLNRLNRLSPIAREFSSGRYSRFSRGLFSAAKDLFEKW